MSDPVPPETLVERLKCIQELTEFTEKYKKQINDIFEKLGWSSDREPMEVCPYDPDHTVPVRTMEKHMAACRLRKMGYSAEEQAAMYDPSVCYENSSVRTFTMDKATQHQVILQARSAAPLMKMEGVFWQASGVSIRKETGSRKFCCFGSGLPDYAQYPLTSYPFKARSDLYTDTNTFPRQYTSQPVDVPLNHKRAVCDLTVADRLAVYDHVVGLLNQEKEAASAVNDDLYVDLVSKLQKNEKQNEPKTHLELMAEMRDYKRRRQSYRAKNVHITKKSYTEVIREVINVHSEELAKQWKEEADEEEAIKSRHSSSRRWTSERRSSSSESRHSHGKRHRRENDRENKKKRKKEKERDSSPDDHHHDRKKKKKKKKDDRKKEK